MSADCIGRRIILCAGAGTFVRGTAHASAKPEAPHLWDLFAFGAPSSRNPVFAVVGPRPALRAACAIRIHAGGLNWTVERLRPRRTAAMWDRDNVRFFAGSIRDAAGAHRIAIVLEPRSGIVDRREALAVWAEILCADGVRRRAGNPLFAALLAGDTTLARRYHAVSPGEDRALFADVAARRIAAVAAGNVSDPMAHARRLIARMLPDVLAYRPDHPVGFNFASQNGRHPSDDSAAVVATMLTGAICRPAPSTRFLLGEAFPYFLS